MSESGEIVMKNSSKSAKRKRSPHLKNSPVSHKLDFRILMKYSGKNRNRRKKTLQVTNQRLFRKETRRRLVARRASLAKSGVISMRKDNSMRRPSSQWKDQRLHTAISTSVRNTTCTQWCTEIHSLVSLHHRQCLHLSSAHSNSNRPARRTTRPRHIATSRRSSTTAWCSWTRTLTAVGKRQALLVRVRRWARKWDRLGRTQKEETHEKAQRIDWLKYIYETKFQLRINL